MNTYFELLQSRRCKDFCTDSKKITMMYAQTHSLVASRNIVLHRLQRLLRISETIPRFVEIKRNGIVNAICRYLPGNAKENMQMPPQKHNSETNRRIMINREVSFRWTFDTYSPLASMTYLEVPRRIVIALEKTDRRWTGERTRDPSLPLALTMTNWVINCGRLSTSISLNFDWPAKDNALSTCLRKSITVAGAALNLSLNEAMRTMQYR